MIPTHIKINKKDDNLGHIKTWLYQKCVSYSLTCLNKIMDLGINIL